MNHKQSICLGMLVSLLISSFLVSYAGDVPCAPENIRVTGASLEGGSALVDFSWDSPGWASGCRYTLSPTFKTYKIYATEYSASGVSLGKKLLDSPGTGQSYRASFKPNTRYEVGVSTEYSNGVESVEASSGTIIVGDEGSACTVTGLQSYKHPSDEDGTITLEWDESCPTALRPLSYSIVVDGSKIAEVSANTSGRYTTKLHLSKGTYYQANVYTAYTNQISSRSVYTTFTTTGNKESDAMAKVHKNELSLRGKLGTLNSVTLTWNLPTWTPVNDTYRVGAFELYYTEYNSQGKALSETFVTTLPPVTTYTLSSLKPSTKYAITLKGKSSSRNVVSEDTFVVEPNSPQTSPKEGGTPETPKTEPTTPVLRSVDMGKAILQITQSSILIRGYIETVSGDTYTIRTLGGAWTFTVTPNTQYVSTDLARPLIRVGDFVGVRGRFAEGKDFTFVADALRNRTLVP